jgi:hypothetical protein
LALAGACSGGAGSGGDDNTSKYDRPVSPEIVIDVVEAFDPAEPGAVLSLNEVVAVGSEAVPDLLPLLESEDPNRQFAALYVALLLTDTDEEIALVTPLLGHEEITIRTMVAGALAGHGVVEALPVLIEAMSSEADLPFSDPPRLLAAFAQSALEAYTRESFADAPAWEAWWRDVESSIEWAGETYVAR